MKKEGSLSFFMIFTFIVPEFKGSGWQNNLPDRREIYRTRSVGPVPISLTA
jgi:hypothetical protein